MTQTVTAPATAGSAIDQAAKARPDLAPLITSYFQHIPIEDSPRRAADVDAVIDGHLRVAAERAPGEAKIRVFNPTGQGDQWSETSTVIDIVNDDMPGLVDAVVGSLTEAGVIVHRVLHPILAVRREDNRLVEVIAGPAHSSARSGVLHESWIHVLIDRLADATKAEELEEQLAIALDDVRAIVADAPALMLSLSAAARELRWTPSPRPADEVTEGADLLDWLAAGSLTLLGYRRDVLGTGEYADELRAVPGSGLGILRDSSPRCRDFDDESVTPTAAEGGQVLITQASHGSAVTRGVPPFCVAVRIIDADGRVLAEHRFLGILNARALTADVSTTPVLRRKVAAVLAALQATPASYTGQQSLELLTGYPRAELFWADTDFVVDLVTNVLQLASRRRLRAFLQTDPYHRFVTVMVYLPRDRYTTDSRLAMQRVLLDALGGKDIRYTARVGDSLLAAVHFTVRTDPDHQVDADLLDLTERLRETIRTWEDRLVSAVVGGDDQLDTAGAMTRYADAFDEAYKEHYSPTDAVADLRILDGLASPDDLALTLSELDPETGQRRLKVFSGSTISLSRALPVLQHLGPDVLDEQPFEVTRTDGTECRIYDFGLRFSAEYMPEDVLTEGAKARLAEAFIRSWRGDASIDGFNRLVLTAGLDWRQVSVIRAYTHYLRQLGTPYTQRYLERVLVDNTQITRLLIDLFGRRFDPDGDPVNRDADCDELAQQVVTALDGVSSLDADRIVRIYLSLILATDRTNVYQRDGAGESRPYLAFKLDPGRIAGVPEPVPAHEIWVYSPRVEGVHLRFGAVARGGLRWSDRPEDYRTEILARDKAQEVKNAVIVPVGAPGGFVMHRPPAVTGDAVNDREALQAEGIACYRLFISGMLDLTDNRVDGEVVPPDSVVRHDGDDPYLVVAADKGTATFSDIANGLAVDRGFWLGDAFASGGSSGYDHKGMGITARGAWESVKHHFRELGVDTQTTDFTCVGVGDMSGDVFGNGMLLSEHIRLVAAFDHRHVFVDPNPDAARSFAERRRLFALPRSSWADYDTALISEGGGVFPRTAKAIRITPQMRAALGIAEETRTLTPVELIRAALLAPVDLLWNGGIGTYVKASTEANTEVGDKANDAVRVDGQQLQVKVVGEGGNLGVTQRGRIEFARAGGRINTDAIDNSAGVDTSDHEVNIKIALTPVVASGQLSEAGRDELLAEMTDEVAALVLADNTAQNRVLGASRHHAVPMLSVYGRLIGELVGQGRLNRELEFLPTDAQIAARVAAGQGPTSPELAVLMAYVKSTLTREMLASDLPDQSAFADRLPAYFPTAMRERYPEAIAAHPLAREIVTTETVNAVVNGAGITYAFRLGEEMAASPTDTIRAYTVATEVFALDRLCADVAAQDNQVPAACQDTMLLEIRRLLDRASRWFLTRRPQPLDVTAEIDRYRDPIAAQFVRMPRLVCGVEHDNVRGDAAALVALGAPVELANRVAYALYTFSLLDVVDVAGERGRSMDESAALYYALSAHLDFDRLLSDVTALARGDRWHALARQALRDDLYRSLREITADVLSTTRPDQQPAEKIAQWEAENQNRLARARTTLGQIGAAGAGDLAALSVAAREVRTMVR
jgi:glutamate dehydrogenase